MAGLEPWLNEGLVVIVFEWLVYQRRLIWRSGGIANLPRGRLWVRDDGRRFSLSRNRTHTGGICIRNSSARIGRGFSHTASTNCIRFVCGHREKVHCAVVGSTCSLVFRSASHGFPEWSSPFTEKDEYIEIIDIGSRMYFVEIQVLRNENIVETLVNSPIAPLEQAYLTYKIGWLLGEGWESQPPPPILGAKFQHTCLLENMLRG